MGGGGWMMKKRRAVEEGGSPRKAKTIRDCSNGKEETRPTK